MNQKASSLNTNWIAAGSMLAGTSLLVALTVPFVFLPTSKRTMLPYMATPSTKLRKALHFIADASSASGRRSTHAQRAFLDLGSGDGEAVYQALSIQNFHTQAPFYKQATGIELNSTLWLLSNIRRLFWNRPERERSRFVCQDFWKTNLKEIDTILIFGVQPLMKPLSEKLARDCGPGTHILSYRFFLPLAPEDSSPTASEPGLLQAKLVYDEEEMRIYECIGNDHPVNERTAAAE